MGGRLGYAVLYAWPQISGDFSLLLKTDVGSASFHGGLLGLVIYTGFHARTRKVSFLNLTDHLAVVAPLGLLLGHLADFMVGEAFGRVTAVRWAMLFPAEVHLPDFTPALPTEMAADVLPATSAEIMKFAHINPDLMRELLRILHPRHPSQLYAAALKGLVLLCVLFGLRRRARRLPDCVLSGVFLLLYGVFRIGCDFLREPTPGDPLRMGLTLEQWLSLPMLLIGTGLLAWGRASARRSAPIASTP